MGTYMQPVTIPEIDIIPHPETETVTVCGKAGTWTFQAGKVIEFDGLGVQFMIVQVHPNGVTMIDAETSHQRFHSWRSMFSGRNIFNDVVRRSGWMTIR